MYTLPGSRVLILFKHFLLIPSRKFSGNHVKFIFYDFTRTFSLLFGDFSSILHFEHKIVLIDIFDVVTLAGVVVAFWLSRQTDAQEEGGEEEQETLNVNNIKRRHLIKWRFFNKK